MSPSYFNVEGSLFAETEKAADEFCHNLFVVEAIQRCVLQMEKAQEEYEAALLMDNKKLATAKEIEIQTYQSSLMLTAHVMSASEEGLA
jgi:RPA family protein